MPLHYARVIRKSMSYQFIDAYTGNTVDLPCLARFYAPLGSMKRSALGIHAWIILSAGKRMPIVAPDLSFVSNSVLFDCIPALVDWIRGLTVDKRFEQDLITMFAELVLDIRISEHDKLLMLTAPAVLPLLPSLVPSFSVSLVRELKIVLGLENKWNEIDTSIDEQTSVLTNALYEPEEIAAFRSGRSSLLLMRDEELRLAEEERQARLLAEEARQAEELRNRKDREEALRAALILGRNRAEPDVFTMTDELQHVFELVENGEKLLFITGKPGTGKSTLIRALRSRLSYLNLVVLSFTGTAALNIGGQTINSFFMMPFNVLELGWGCTRYSFKARAQALEVLIVDEVSMLRPDMLDAMDSALRSARGDTRPFGGVQVLLVGDLHQLPPVIDKDAAVKAYYKEKYDNVRWFFAAKTFENRSIKVVELTRVFRQNAGDFLDFLAEIRSATIAGDRLDWFNRSVRREPEFPQSVFYLTVTPRRSTAAKFNRTRLEELPGPLKSWKARIEERGVSRDPDEGDDTYPADRVLELKLGAQVMMIKNDEGKQWVNGDLGIVERVSRDKIRVTTGTGTWDVERARWPMIKYELDPKTHRLVPREYASFVQFPIRLAWAATIHKMQGQTVDRIKIDLTGGAFESGMTYVALSRCRTMEGIRLTRSLLQSDLLCDTTIIDYMRTLERV